MGRSRSHTWERRPAGDRTLPHITPHSLRRTYISLALVANDFDVKSVMSQVGHADSKMTLDVYAQLEQRIPRHHGENLDRLLRGEDGARGVGGDLRPGYEPRFVIVAGAPTSPRNAPQGSKNPS